MKLTITLTLDDEQAACLVETLKIGASHRYAPRLQSNSAEVAKYVEKRVDDATIARGRAHLRRDTSK